VSRTPRHANDRPRTVWRISALELALMVALGWIASFTGLTCWYRRLSWRWKVLSVAVQTGVMAFTPPFRSRTTPPFRSRTARSAEMTSERLAFIR
jgi:hypothetical protein